MAKELWHSSLTWTVDEDSGENGFVNSSALGIFDAANSTELIAHDVFEHWFENTEYFRQEGFNIAGECVAMGIRQFMYNDAVVNMDVFAYNRHYGLERNSVQTILTLVDESLENYGQYGLNFEFEKHPDIETDKDIVGYFLEMIKVYGTDYNVSDSMINSCAESMAYGYAIAKNMTQKGFDWKNVYLFIENWKLFKEELEYIEINDYGLDLGDRVVFSVRKDNVVASCGTFTISAKMGDTKIRDVVQSVLNKIYAY